MIALNGISKTYLSRLGETVMALSSIDLSIDEKEFVTLLGPSGCGKSTLLKIIIGLIPPTTGYVTIHNQEVIKPRRDVGMVFQQSLLLPWRNVLDNVLLPIEILRKDRLVYRTAAQDLLRLVGLADFERKFPRELSGGMQQRVSICRALVHDPSILLMDEPFGSLDALTREELGIELTEIWEKRKKTVVFVTHSINEAVYLADRVVILTPRPGTIAKIISVPLPRPRNVSMQSSTTFRHLVDEIRTLIFGGNRKEPTPSDAHNLSART
jgi:NitT/TauT family transport system ATP-binding protein